jgi:hypothetical protein
MSLLDKASLIVTQNAVKAGKLYSIIPSSGAGDLEVVRATNATRVNELGLIENVALNLPRIDYTDEGCPSILLEPQRTNLLFYSQDLNNSYYVKNSVTTIANSVISPDGTLNADSVTFNSVQNARIEKGLSVNQTGDYTLSVYLRADINTDVVFRNSFSGAIVNIVTITSVWTRFVITQNISSSGNVFPSISNINSNSATIFVWGLQFEQGSYATSYIPTLGSAVTRNADLIGSINIFTNELNTSGTWFLDQSSNESIGSTSIQYCLFSGDTQFVDGLIIEINSSGALSFRKFTNTVSGIRQVITNSNVARTKLIIRWNESTSIINIFLNGLLAHTFTGQTFVNYESLRFFDSNSSTITSISKVYSTMLFSTPLTDQECIELTTI